jgi:hypothetical protein
MTMVDLDLQANEKVIAKAGAEVAGRSPRSAGDLYLTNSRLIFIPNKFLSLRCGRRLEIPLTTIASSKMSWWMNQREGFYNIKGGHKNEPTIAAGNRTKARDLSNGGN